MCTHLPYQVSLLESLTDSIRREDKDGTTLGNLMVAGVDGARVPKAQTQ